ncbi:uncharacterized protein LOC143292180 [Babylonia areolata]|uniref:uncharacterized protein LOC143292180 n=1 Tax=Babylonia areolata TaxID=304850 RepID=UPI003FCFFF09
MICYSGQTGTDLEMSSFRKSNTSSAATATTTYYDRNHEEDWCKVVTTQPDGTTLAAHAPREPRNYMGLAVVVLVCFNIPFGLLAVLLSVKANQDFQKGNVSLARVKGKVSMMCSVLGIVSTMTAVFLVIFWPAIVPDNG